MLLAGGYFYLDHLESPMEKESEEAARYSRDLDARVKEREERLEKSVKVAGCESMILDMLKKPRLNDEERYDLSDLVSMLALEIPGNTEYDSNGHVKSVTDAAYKKLVREAYNRLVNPQKVFGGSPIAAEKVKSEDANSKPPRNDSPEGGWSVLRHFSGHGIKDTQSFRVDAQEWKIRWKTADDSDPDSNFHVYVYGNDRIQVASNARGIDSGESFIHEAGSYYLSINTRSGYDIWIEVPR